MQITYERRQNTGDFSHKLFTVVFDPGTEAAAARRWHDEIEAILGSSEATTVKAPPTLPPAVTPPVTMPTVAPPAASPVGGTAALPGIPGTSPTSVTLPTPAALPGPSATTTASPSDAVDPAVGFAWTKENIVTFVTQANGRLVATRGADAPALIGEVVSKYCPTEPKRASLVPVENAAAFVAEIKALA